MSKKDEIIRAARETFAEKGFDGANMEEIAENAGVTKSLIYYHFKSKDDLLESITELFFEELGVLMADKKTRGVEEKYFGFLNENNDFIKILLVESLLTNKRNEHVFEIIERMMKYESEVTGKTQLLDAEASHSRWVAEFFTSVLPLALYSCYKDSWCRHFNVSQSRLKEDFFDAFQKTHGEYHKRHLD